MAAFKFRLDSVLRFRERIKEEKQWQLRALNEERRRLIDAIEALEQELLQAGNVLAGCEGRIYVALELRLQGDYAHLVTRRIEERRAALARFEAQLAAKREELVQAMRAVKTLEQLRARYAEKFRRGQSLEEQKIADEIAERNMIQQERGQKLP